MKATLNYWRKSLEVNKPILVVSHERSGTHFLINSIAQNFGLYSDPVNLPVASDIFNDKFNILDKNKYLQMPEILMNFLRQDFESGIILKSHHTADFFCNYQSLLKKFYVFYIYRDVDDLLVSLFDYFNRCPMWFPKPRTVQELTFNMSPKDYPFHYDYSMSFKCPSFVERIANHVEMWLEQPFVYPVSYENLHENFDIEIQNIAEFIKVPPPKDKTRPNKNSNVVIPNIGLVGRGGLMFSSSEREEIEEIYNAYSY